MKEAINGLLRALSLEAFKLAGKGRLGMKPLSIVPFVSGKLKSNSYVVRDNELFCVVIDPGEESTELTM